MFMRNSYNYTLLICRSIYLFTVMAGFALDKMCMGDFSFPDTNKLCRVPIEFLGNLIPAITITVWVSTVCRIN